MGCPNIRSKNRFEKGKESTTRNICYSVIGFLETYRKSLPKKIQDLFPVYQDKNDLSFTLDLKFVTLNDLSLQAVCLTFPAYKQCLYLNLWKSSLGDSGCEKIAPIIKGFSQLKYLSLADNKISSVGLTYLCMIFEDICSLESLELFLNPFKDNGGNILADNIKSLPNLKKIVLDDCELTQKSITQLLTSFSHSGKIERVSLNFNDFSGISIEEIKLLVSSIKSLKLLYIENTGINEADFIAIHQSFPSILISR
jgi:Leucine-rich repeat (LRR) protein